MQGLGDLEDSRFWLIAGIGGLVAGGIHLALSPQHFAEAAGLGLFFLTLGTLQIAWGLWHLARPSYPAWLAGIVIAFASILMYVAGMVFAAPFSAGAEPLDYVGGFTKTVELATLVVLAVPLAAGPILGRSRSKLIVTALVALSIGFAGSAAAYGVGYVAEEAVPSLAEPAGHTHGDGDGDDHAHATTDTPAPGVARIVEAMLFSEAVPHGARIEIPTDDSNSEWIANFSAVASRVGA